ncbi:MAG: hypothetical protein RSD49_17505 [Hafnia sp.]
MKNLVAISADATLFGAASLTIFAVCLLLASLVMFRRGQIVLPFISVAISALLYLYSRLQYEAGAELAKTVSDVDRSPLYTIMLAGTVGALIWVPLLLLVVSLFHRPSKS